MTKTLPHHAHEQVVALVHDDVIEHLFAVGLLLEASARRSVDPDDARKLRRGIDQLDDAIAELRRLRTSVLPGPITLRALGIDAAD